MNTKRWISLGIAVLVIILAIVLTNVLPIWITLYAGLAFVAGFVAGYLFKNPEVLKVIEYVEKTVEKPVKAIKVKKNKKVE